MATTGVLILRLFSPEYRNIALVYVLGGAFFILVGRSRRCTLMAMVKSSSTPTSPLPPDDINFNTLSTTLPVTALSSTLPFFTPNFYIRQRSTNSIQTDIEQRDTVSFIPVRPASSHQISSNMYSLDAITSQPTTTSKEHPKEPALENASMLKKNSDPVAPQPSSDDQLPHLATTEPISKLKRSTVSFRAPFRPIAVVDAANTDSFYHSTDIFVTGGGMVILLSTVTCMMEILILFLINSI